ncbi:hypothetical protein [Chryseobacterium gossypii]|uniref:hypothetical protein n=1 Tax=Chryseobacterium gossypii TaxID=3231602 RepID=UPI0035264737
MENINKYRHLKYENKEAFEIVNEIMLEGKMPLIAVKKIKEIFPFLSLEEAKEIVVSATSEYKSLYDCRENLFGELDDLDI